MAAVAVALSVGALGGGAIAEPAGAAPVISAGATRTSRTDRAALASRIVAIASAEVGTVEDPPGSNHVVGKPYGTTGGAWCANFATWVLHSAGIDPAGRGRGAFNTNIARAWSVYGPVNGYGRMATRHDARVGDLLVDYYDGTPTIGGHVSIVVRVGVDGRGDLVETVGGNESDGVRLTVKDLDDRTRYLVTLAELR